MIYLTVNLNLGGNKIEQKGNNNKSIKNKKNYILVAFCAGLTLYFIYSVYFPKASIVINKDGIKQKAMRGKGPIKWEKINEIYICVIPKKKYDTYFLGIKYRKDENDTRKVKFKGKVDQKIGDAVLVIDELEMQPYDIYNNIQKYYSKFIRK